MGHGDATGTDPGGTDDGGGTDASGTGDADGTADSTYRGILGAFPYALRATDSWLCKGYVVVGTLVAVVVCLLFLVGVVSAFKNTVGAVGGSFTFSRSFVFLVGVIVGIPLIAPILVVARRHRLGQGSADHDRALAATGFGYALSLYVALVISAPTDMREAPPAAIAPIVEALYILPPLAGIVPPAVVVVLMYVGHRAYRTHAAES